MSELAFLTRGDPRSPPLIFLHGFLGCKEDWEGLFPYFENKYHCIALDLPSHGESPEITPVLPAIQKALNTQRPKPICIGYSLGGRIALQLSNQFRTLFALSAHPGLSSDAEKTARRKKDLQWKALLETLPIDDFLRQWYAQPLFSSLTKNTKLFNTLLSRRKKQDAHALSRFLMEMSLAEQPRVESYSTQTHFFFGKEDWQYRTLYSTISGSVRAVENSGHAIHLENPEKCAQLILEAINASP